MGAAGPGGGPGGWRVFLEGLPPRRKLAKRGSSPKKRVFILSSDAGRQSRLFCLPLEGRAEIRVPRTGETRQLRPGSRVRAMGRRSEITTRRPLGRLGGMGSKERIS